LLLLAVIAVLGGALVFRGGQGFGRILAFAEIAGFGLVLLWKFVLLAVVFFWLRSAWRGNRQD